MPTLSSLAVLPFLAYVVLYHSPKAAVSTSIAITSPRYVSSSYATTYGAALLFGFLAFGHSPKIVDFVVPAMLFYGMSRCALTCRNSDTHWGLGVYPVPTEPSANRAALYASSTRLARAYLKDILSNPESRKIFYFLMLNMCYMLVQMLYGIWTNSLGLISDGMEFLKYLLQTVLTNVYSYTYGIRLHGHRSGSDCICNGPMATE